MTVEHRAAPGLDDIEVELADHGQVPAMRLRRAGPAEAAPEPETPAQRIVQTLADAETPLSQRRSANAPRPGLRPLVPRSRSSSGNTASSVHPEAATVSPAPASTARTRYRYRLEPLGSDGNGNG